MPSTPSSASASADNTARRPPRAAIVVLVLVSLAIPSGVLGLIVAHKHHQQSADVIPTGDSSPTDKTKARTGTLAPDFTLPSTTGARVSLSSLRGHPVVIVFFASWCHPCQEELPVLERFAHDDAGRLRVIGVNFQDLPSDTKHFVQQLGVNFPALLEDPSGPVANEYGILGIPQTVFVDAHGIVRGRVYGQTSRKSLQPAIDDLLHGVNIRSI